MHVYSSLNPREVKSTSSKPGRAAIWAQTAAGIVGLVLLIIVATGVSAA